MRSPSAGTVAALTWVILYGGSQFVTGGYNPVGSLPAIGAVLAMLAVSFAVGVVAAIRGGRA